MSRHPEVIWAQRVDKVYITVLLPDAKNPKVNLEPDGVFAFSASAGAENYSYELKLNLFNKLNVEESKINIGLRSILCVLEKAETGWWKKLLRGDEKTPHYVKVDWDKWVDEDDDNGPTDLDLGGMDFSNFGGMEGQGDGGDAMDDGFDDDSDDEEGGKAEIAAKMDVTEKTEEAPQEIVKETGEGVTLSAAKLDAHNIDD